jgi:hypothetical protein
VSGSAAPITIGSPDGPWDPDEEPGTAEPEADEPDPVVADGEADPAVHAAMVNTAVSTTAGHLREFPIIARLPLLHPGSRGIRTS